MSIFQPQIPDYETSGTKVVAQVEPTGGGLFGLWPRAVYEGDTRPPSKGGSDLFGGLFSAIFGRSSSQANYDITPPAPALTSGRSEKPPKTER